MASVILHTSRLAKEFGRLHDKLRRVFNVMLDIWPEDKNVYITSIYRTSHEDKQLKGSGVHHTIPHRAMDVRTHSLSSSELTTITRKLNSAFDYDPEREKLCVALDHDSGFGMHLHLQVRDDTREKNVPPPAEEA